jgi:hypothetical protein
MREWADFARGYWRDLLRLALIVATINLAASLALEVDGARLAGLLALSLGSGVLMLASWRGLSRDA